MLYDEVKVTELETRQDYFKALEILIKAKNESYEPDKVQIKIDDILAKIKLKAINNTTPIKVEKGVTFGTSGWRGKIGDSYNLANVIRITKSLIETLKCEDLHPVFGVKNYDEVQKLGIAIIHDNRYLGDFFSKVVFKLFTDAGIKAVYGGEATTAEVSIYDQVKDVAASINLTPSHNPFDYAGYKVNPSDGGPAGSEITQRIEEFAIEEMKKDVEIPDLDFELESIDILSIYKSAFENKLASMFNLSDIVKKINSTDIKIVVDNVHGATRGRIEKLLEGVDKSKIKYLRTDTDYLFNGVKPEPSNDNLKLADDTLAKSDAALKVAMIMDPDGDRVRFSDGKRAIEMNHFGPMLAYYLIKEKQLDGTILKSVATSNFGNAVAEHFGRQTIETSVGFKEFRPYLKANEAVLAFEESDGLTVQNWTLDKDALVGAIAGIAMTLETNMLMGDYLKVVQDAAGYYYPAKDGQLVPMELVGAKLKAKLSPIAETYPVGTIVDFSGKEKTVTQLLTLDGHKLVFEDGSWLLIRPSGTEPKVRFYVEARDPQDTKALFDKAEDILNDMLNA